MATLAYSYTIYHSPNAYLGTVLLRRALAGLPGVELVRRPFCIPRETRADRSQICSAAGKTAMPAPIYREDCRRWSERCGIPMSYPAPDVFHERAERWALSSYDREELPARAFYAADPGKRDLLDQALFEAAWVAGLDVNEPATIRWAAERAGLDPDRLMTLLAEPGPGEQARAALAEFERLQCPGVPTVVVDGQRFFGKDRVDWVADICRGNRSAAGAGLTLGRPRRQNSPITIKGRRARWRIYA